MNTRTDRNRQTSDSITIAIAIVLLISAMGVARAADSPNVSYRTVEIDGYVSDETVRKALKKTRFQSIRWRDG